MGYATLPDTVNADALFDEIALFKHTLSQTDIEVLSQGGCPTKYSNVASMDPLAYWDMGETFNALQDGGMPSYTQIYNSLPILGPVVVPGVAQSLACDGD